PPSRAVGGSGAMRGVAGGAALLALASGFSPDRVLADDAPAPPEATTDESPVKTPPTAILDELKKRLLAPPDCAVNGGSCADIPPRAMDAGADVLMLRLTVDAQADIAVPLPVPALTSDASQAAWQPTLVQVDGREAPLHRDADGSQLWVALARGRHEL